ncbi:hypothetical protein GCM10010521_07220 [Streptomyces rameus]|uniref:Uncharacterized protein n=1 Tax=Streptomyces rameus TaxID=68261 RepID=A0ABP6MRE7_9ACTN
MDVDGLSIYIPIGLVLRFGITFKTRVFPVQVRWIRAPGGRRRSSLVTVERPRTAQPCRVQGRARLTTDTFDVTSLYLSQRKSATTVDAPNRSGARVSRYTLTGLSHAIGLVVDHGKPRRPARDDGAGAFSLGSSDIHG